MSFSQALVVIQVQLIFTNFVFRKFVTDELIETILEQTLLYKEWRNINTSKERMTEINKYEIRMVIGITPAMGVKGSHSKVPIL